MPNTTWLRAQWQYPSRRWYIIIAGILGTLLIAFVVGLLVSALKAVSASGWITFLVILALIVWLILAVKDKRYRPSPANLLKVFVGAVILLYLYSLLHRISMTSFPRYSVVEATKEGSRVLRPGGRNFSWKVMNTGGCSYIIEYKAVDEPGLTRLTVHKDSPWQKNLPDMETIQFFADKDCQTVHMKVWVGDKTDEPPLIGELTSPPLRRAFFYNYFLLSSENKVTSGWNTKKVGNKSDKSIGTKHDKHADEPINNFLFPEFPSLRFARTLDKLEKAPEENHKR